MMSASQRKLGRLSLALTLAASLLISYLPLAFAGPGDVNSVNNGQIIQGGNYYNTAGGRTVFQNSSSLHLRAGDLVVGREVTDAATKTLTGNGGSLTFNAPIVRLDGNVDVNGVMQGGNVVINSAFLYQNGNIFANGANAGSVQINVGSMNMGPNAQIQATSTGGGAGGYVGIKATKDINIATNAIIDTSGKVIGAYNTNVINIQGGLVNLDGIVKANGLVAGDQGGAIALVALNNLNIGSSASVTANGAAGGNGGVVAIGAKGSVNNNGIVTANGGNGYFSFDTTKGDAGNGGVVLVAAPKTISDVMTTGNFALMRKGAGAANITNNGAFAANGGDGFVGYNPTNGGNGGYVDIKSQNRLDNNGLILSNGGNGGENPDVAIGSVWEGKQWTPGQDAGHGGNAGQITLSFKKNSITNNGYITANGGNGGNGQDAVSNDPRATEHYAKGGNGGNGGNGGLVEFYGLPSRSVLDHTFVSGGSGGRGGQSDPSKCGCVGSSGTCGQPGQIAIHPPNELPPPPPTPPQFPLYPRENLRNNEGLPGAASVLSYNRSIFLARAPLPIIQKRRKPPVEVAPPPPPPPNPKPKPAPPKRKATVRGYW